MTDDEILQKVAADATAPETGPEAIQWALRNIDLDKEEAKARETLRTGSKTKRPKAVHTLNIIHGMRRNDITPEDYMIKDVPVIPTKYRPFAAQGDSLIPGDANVLYKDLFDVRDAHIEEAKVFGAQNAGQSREDLYNAVKSVYGYGDPVKAKTQAKDVQGFLKKIVGSTAKHSFVQYKMLSKTQDNVGRSTIIVDPDLGLDDIGIPREIAFDMFKPFIQRRLKQQGMKNVDALKAVTEQNEMATRALEKEIESRPVIYSRAPAWHMHSVLGGNVKLTDHKAISINPYVTTGLNADFDGDFSSNVIEIQLDTSELETVSNWGVRGVTNRQIVNYACLINMQ